MSPRSDGPARLALPSRLRGVYRRVARQLKVHPSYVSRVAHGKRRSERISNALKTEIQRSLSHPFALGTSARVSTAVLRNGWQTQHRITVTQLLNNILDTIVVFARSASIAEPNSEAKRRCLTSAYNSHNNVRTLLQMGLAISNSDARKIHRKLDMAESALHQAGLQSGYVLDNLNNP